MDNTVNKPSQCPSGNPFLDRLDEHLSTNNLEEKLQSWPLAKLDMRNLDLQSRHDLLDRLQEQMFEPTLTSLDTATRLYRMIRRGYIGRDPTLVQSRARAMTIARCAGKDLRDLPWLPCSAKGMRISGVTGLGKSYEILRALKQLPQKIEHGKSYAADWNHLTQATWLHVAMSHDGSIGGLLLQILTALDLAIGTSYSLERSLTNLSNEKLAVHVGIILINHGVGVLVIDEIQKRNFSGGTRGGLAATFFLRLLNFGVPIVLMGNPLGMNSLDTFSQDMRRVGSAGSIEMHPLEETDYDFTDCIAPALWRYNVMPEPSPISDTNGSLLFKYCGGIRDYGARIRASSQRLALDMGESFVTEEHMQEAFYGPDFSQRDRDLITGFRDKNPIILQQFEDIPWEFYAMRWGLFPSQDQDKQSSLTKSGGVSVSVQEKESTPTVKARKSVAQQATETVKRNRTRKENQETSREKIKSTLESSDIRRDGLQEYLISSLEQLRSSESRGNNDFQPKGA
ncbi:ATP-binding protein [Undibacterium sp. CY21W]|uniref:ATP-binding protein n=1 Tax=Undibacterium sp. CY21W TaxID=2762293 RepID=UPI00164B0A7C|nr:ATP-binding protein [Undibacterium sp. CY21W]MBC3927331.1 ATP-binding protein [Undibacterium sp. CY21W]